MRILSLSEPIRDIRYLNAGRGPGNFYTDRLPIHTGKVDQLPDGLAAIIATADLQGRETFKEARGQPPRLLGETLPARLLEEVLPELDLPPGRVGVVLAGDFYTVPLLDKRGGTGDVTEVWRAFGDQFDWVVGVAGNHDLFGSKKAKPPRFGGNLHFLDEGHRCVDSLRFAGVSGIIGNPSRLWRRMVDDYCAAVEHVMQGQDVSTPAGSMLVLHDGPDDPTNHARGSPAVRELLELLAPTLVVRGHAHWTKPLAELSNGTQVLNVDARCVILTA